MIVLAAIAIKNTGGTDESMLGASCFTVTNSEDDTWDLCGNATKEKDDWVCAI